MSVWDQLEEAVQAPPTKWMLLARLSEEHQRQMRVERELGLLEEALAKLSELSPGGNAYLTGVLETMAMSSQLLDLTSEDG